MSVSRRRTTAYLLSAVLTVGALALTGCSGSGSGTGSGTGSASGSGSAESATPTRTASAPAAPASPSGGEGTPADAATPSPVADGEAPGPEGGSEGSGTGQEFVGGAAWAGTKQFVQIKDAWTADGRTYAAVRTAEKKADTRFEAWVMTPGDGPWITVTLAEDARVLLTVQVRGDDPSGAPRGEAVPSTRAEFVTRLGRLQPQERERIGYDLSFDGDGRVVKLQSLYTP
ncbi:hypothetical protein [Streptomyces sp. NPDC002640]